MDARVSALLDKIVSEYSRILGSSLTGIYVHGSLALGSFRWASSDIDFLAVVSRAPTAAQKAELMKSLYAIHRAGNPRGFEMSVILEKYCARPACPTPFELHFSNGTQKWYESNPTEYIEKMRGDDPDLASYMAVIKQSGIAYSGRPIEDVFGDVPRAAYLKSVLYDIKDAREDFSENYAYHTLNLCRTLAYLDDGVIRSKRGGGQWALANLPAEHRKMIETALTEYNEGVKGKYDAGRAGAFLDYALSRLDAGTAD